MSNQQPILSICIPTYNRSEILDETLALLFSNPDFDSNLIEVIVYDNCSSDNTANITKKYPLTKYYKTEKNIPGANLTLALEKSTGSYIRLFNDTLRFNNGKLKRMLQLIQMHQQEEKNLFFFNNMFLNKNCMKQIYSKTELLKNISFWATWIGNFGVWKVDFEKLTDKNRFVETLLLHIDWLYKIAENKKVGILYFDDWFGVKEVSKGGYNIFDVFLNKYLYLLKCFELPFLQYKIEKYWLLYHFVFYFYKLLFIQKEKHTFETKNSTWIIFKKYWYEPYFILLPLILSFRALLKIKKIKK